MRFCRYFLVICLSASLAHSAIAQDIEDIPFFDTEEARAAVLRALAALPKVICGREACAAPTAEEQADPPVTPDEARIALITGAKSARLKWCGLKWEDRAYAGLMMHLQTRGIYETRKRVLFRLIHDHQFNKVYLGLQALKTCSDETRARLDKDNPLIKLERWQRVANNALLEQSVADMLSRVVADIQNSRCGPVHCAPATKEEKANPPLTIEQARLAMRVGLFSGAAEFCALDWRKEILFPFLGYHRNTLKMSTRQLAMVSVLHGTMQSFILEKYRKHEKSCSDAMRQNLQKEMSQG
jgi:hypothetical protein